MSSRSPLPVRHAQMRVSILMRLVLSLVVYPLNGCAPQTKPLLVNRDLPPTLTQACPAEPPRNEPFLDDNEMFIWISRAIEAGAECRSAHKKLAAWAKEPPP